MSHERFAALPTRKGQFMTERRFPDLDVRRAIVIMVDDRGLSEKRLRHGAARSGQEIAA